MVGDNVTCVICSWGESILISSESESYIAVVVFRSESCLTWNTGSFRSFRNFRIRNFKSFTNHTRLYVLPPVFVLYQKWGCIRSTHCPATRSKLSVQLANRTTARAARTRLSCDSMSLHCRCAFLINGNQKYCARVRAAQLLYIFNAERIT